MNGVLQVTPQGMWTCQKCFMSTNVQQMWWIDAVFLFCFCTTGIWYEIMWDLPKITLLLLLYFLEFFICKVIAEMYFYDTCSQRYKSISLVNVVSLKM